MRWKEDSFHAGSRECGAAGWLKVPEGIWSLLVFTSNAMVPTDSLYCCQLNGIMSVWKVFENEPKIIFTSGWLLLPHVNRTLSEWPSFWACINCSFNLDWGFSLRKPFPGLNYSIYWFFSFCIFPWKMKPCRRKAFIIQHVDWLFCFFE